MDPLSEVIDLSQENLFSLNSQRIFLLITLCNGINRVTWQSSSHSYQSFLESRRKFIVFHVGRINAIGLTRVPVVLIILLNIIYFSCFKFIIDNLCS